jgi:t-SNARE complex subunit (syntaxin)
VAIDDLMESMDQGVVEPSEVLDTIMTAAAPSPQTVEERHSELEEKVVKETIRQFTRGGMYFSYSFGTHFLKVYTP